MIPNGEMDIKSNQNMPHKQFFFFISLSIHIYIYIYICMCVCIYIYMYVFCEENVTRFIVSDQSLHCPYPNKDDSISEHFELKNVKIKFETLFN